MQWRSQKKISGIERMNDKKSISFLLIMITGSFHCEYLLFIQGNLQLTSEVTHYLIYK
ncbi:hypothetical protein MtrunA17_Chr7g0268511 [Medicago truncatula]|uniref:Transmembrane protein n=1 Tax=Medicago truncatula TaxID=3880 RepID=A0A396H8L8_MEDTR|nr:hypothetical protein MtrunA17_Chr7g0268511 [Medicago truncatula]